MEEKDKKAELSLLAIMEDLPSAGAKRAFAKSIDLDWEEYLRLRRKWSRVLDRWNDER